MRSPALVAAAALGVLTAADGATPAGVGQVSRSFSREGWLIEGPR
jgi:hypothetical protein